MENPHRRFFWQLRRWKEKLFVDLTGRRAGSRQRLPRQKVSVGPVHHCRGLIDKHFRLVSLELQRPVTLRRYALLFALKQRRRPSRDNLLGLSESRYGDDELNFSINRKFPPATIAGHPFP
jgi:hypothetical protein